MLVVLLIDVRKIALDCDVLRSLAFTIMICMVIGILLDGADILHRWRWSCRGHAAPCQERVFRFCWVRLQHVVCLDLRDHK